MRKINSIKEQLEKYKVGSHAEAVLKKEEVPKARKPSLYKDFPEDITDIPTRELGSYLGMYEAQSAWIKYLVVKKEIDRDYANTLLEYVYSKLYMDAEGNASDKKAYVLGNDFYLQCQKELLEIDAELKMLNASLEACERYARSISREISNRKSDAELYGKVNKIIPDGEVFNE